MKWSDVQDLDLNTIGNASVPIKAVIIGLVCLVLSGGGWWFDIQHQYLALEQAEKREPELTRLPQLTCDFSRFWGSVIL